MFFFILLGQVYTCERGRLPVKVLYATRGLLHLYGILTLSLLLPLGVMAKTLAPEGSLLYVKLK